MPIYEYICMKCNERFSLLQSIHVSENDTQCPKCASKEVRKAVSSFSCSGGSRAVFSPPVSTGGFSGGG